MNWHCIESEDMRMEHSHDQAKNSEEAWLRKEKKYD